MIMEKSTERTAKMVKIISVKCPECNASISIEDNRKECFCQYCGTKIIIDDGSTMHTYRKIDEARIKEAEAHLKELEIKEREQISKERRKMFKIKISLVLGIIGAIMMVIGFLGGEASGNSDSSIYGLAFVGLFCFLAISYIWMSDDK
jgi:DNA-directed RNA polymerase subunit RPC12/RpoP|nr:hypothetical protein [uncultured Acetatifactor sp.]